MPARVRRNNTFVLLNEELSVTELWSDPSPVKRAGKIVSLFALPLTFPAYLHSGLDGSYQFFGRYLDIPWLAIRALCSVTNRNEVESSKWRGRKEQNSVIKRIKFPRFGYLDIFEI